MQRTQVFKAVSLSAISDAVNAFFVANAAFVGVSISISTVGSGFEALLLFTP